MRIYLDNCSFNRPFDDQTQMKIRLETEAKLFIQNEILKGNFELVWSYILDYENSENPYEQRKETIQAWKDIAVLDCEADDKVILLAEKFESMGLKAKDALHLACAVIGKCQYFITTDAKILNKQVDLIEIINPLDFIRILEGDFDED
ncbi:MAG: PIN domain-containing protein [Eubacteriales bacterium]|nr:PIN domain-containing protein [Eubacteriales bacterium]